MTFLAAAAGFLIAVTAGIHSVLGERKMLRPLLGSGAFAALPRAGGAIRYTWHLATLLMLLTALAIAWPGTPQPVVVVMGVAYLGLGLLALYMTKGRHVSGPMFTAAGLLTLASAFLGERAA